MKATILIPNYNNASFLIECLTSIKEQTYTDFNILIIDDASTDNSVNIITEFDDFRITLIKKSKNSGIIDSLNIGLEAIDSEYIIRMDGDDIMHKDRVKKLISFMDKNEDIGVCGSGIQHFGISNDTIIYEQSPIQNHTNLIFGHSVGHASVILRTTIIKNNNITYSKGYTYIEDYKLFYDLSQVTKMTSIPDILYYYRREEYNNFKHEDIKKIGYKKIYSEILSKLEFKNLGKSSEIHYQLYHNTKITLPIKSLIAHLKLIKKQNLNLKLYDSELVFDILKQIKSKLFYRLADQNKTTFLSLLKYQYISLDKLYYHFRK